MYPCLAYYQMANDGEIGVCEADINSTISSMITLYLTKRPGYVSDPVIDTSSDRIIYSHCVACRKVYGKDDPRTCQYYLRSHAEDKKGASVQVIFPCGEKLTTVQISNADGWASVHSSVSCGIPATSHKYALTASANSCCRWLKYTCPVTVWIAKDIFSPLCRMLPWA